MQARIRKEELLSFKAQSGHIIPKKDLQPILSFLKIQVDGDFATITKSNNREFIVKSVPNDSEDCEFLVDEDILYNFLELCESDYVNFAITPTMTTSRIELSAGRARMISPTDQPHLYPTLDLSNENWIPISKLVAATAGICSKIIMDSETMMNAQAHFFVNSSFAAGSDFSIMYYQAIKEELPQLVLRREVAQCLSKMSVPQYSSNANYDLLKDDQTLFGFSKSDLGFFDMSKALTEKLSVSDFSVNKNAMIRFCQSCVSASKGIGSATLEMIEPNNLHLELVDSGNGLDIHLDVSVKGEKGTFKFNPELMMKLLKVIPCDDVYFWPGDKRYYITDMDKTFVSVIMLII